MKIHIFQIKVSEGRRETSQEAIHELADSISKVGLLNPITVDKDYTLIAGLHRLEAAKLLGWEEIECNISDLEGLMVELAEIDENFVRKGLSDIERGDLLLRRKEIYEVLHPETIARNLPGHTSNYKPSSRKMRPEDLPFTQDTAKKLGVSKCTVERQIQTAKNLTPEAKKIIREADIKITKQNMLKLSRLSPKQQAEAATQLVTKAIRSIDDYRPAFAEAGATREKKLESSLNENQAPQSPAPSWGTPDLLALETGYYPTIRDSVADLKNPDKDRSITPKTFLMSFSLFLQRFCRSVKSYGVNEYEPVFPALTQEHLEQIQQEICIVHTALDNLFKIIEKKSKK